MVLTAASGLTLRISNSALSLTPEPHHDRGTWTRGCLLSFALQRASQKELVLFSTPKASMPLGWVLSMLPEPVRKLTVGHGLDGPSFS